MEEAKEVRSCVLWPEIVNLPDNQTGHTPLWIAANKGNLKVISLLLKNGANANIKETENQDPSLVAVLENKSLDDAEKFEI